MTPCTYVIALVHVVCLVVMDSSFHHPQRCGARGATSYRLRNTTNFLNGSRTLGLVVSWH